MNMNTRLAVELKIIAKLDSAAYTGITDCSTSQLRDNIILKAQSRLLRAFKANKR